MGKTLGTSLRLKKHEQKNQSDPNCVINTAPLFAELLFQARDWTECLISIISFNPHDIPRRRISSQVIDEESGGFGELK